ncbi:hypothetical protein G184_gp46 [Erwinia phage ENT90]|uniref:Uncharacterized protein n=1 Tax=Erwinia phage ENT90 TaxID=947843 RepID=F1BUR3_9CAUD|nr:hypothetical protein G184_gp46 [Erwinia phage ENT90]ADX32418.1 hypothetical protein [Erwinia phage ENT90]
MRQVDFDAIGFAAPPFVEQLARPERISGVRQARRRGKVGGAPLFMQRHAAGDLSQLLEFRYPEIFIEIQVAGVALRGAHVGAKKNQAGTVRQHNRVALQVNVHLAGKVNDVVFKDVRLRLAGRQKYLVAPGGQRVNQRLAGKVERGTYLARLQDVADTVIQSGFVPVELIFKAVIHKQAGQLFRLLVAEDVLHDRLALAFVTVAYVRIQIGLVAAAAVALHAGEAFNLTAKRVYLFVVTIAFDLFQDELN